VLAKEEEAAAAEVVVETEVLTKVEVERIAEYELVVKLLNVEEGSKVSKCTNQKEGRKEGGGNAPNGSSRGCRDDSGNGGGRHHTD
jgi:hypothetical protein